MLKFDKEAHALIEEMKATQTVSGIPIQWNGKGWNTKDTPFPLHHAILVIYKRIVVLVPSKPLYHKISGIMKSGFNTKNADDIFKAEGYMVCDLYKSDLRLS